jgi:hypothetical protein
MPLTMPVTPGFTDSRFGIEFNTQSFVSPFTKSVQRVALGGARWTASLTLPPMKRDKASLWQAFFLQCEGGANTFYVSDPDAKTPRGRPLGNPQVKGAGQTGSTLLIDGCTPNITGWLMPGDYFEVNGEYKMITSRADTDGSGEVTLNFKPALRNSPADNAVINVDNPRCIMAMVDDQQGMWECNAAGLYQPKTFVAIEVFS